MKNYATVKEVNKEFIIFEVEMISYERPGPKTKLIRFEEKFDVQIWVDSGRLNEEDIFMVEHDGTKINKILYRDEAEKKRRLNKLIV